MGRIVVVGFGMVAHRFVGRLRALGGLDRHSVTVIGEEPCPAYDRVHLTGWLGRRDRKGLELPIRDWNEDERIRVITGDAATSIKRAERRVETAAGRRIPYDKLVLATGSTPIVPSIAGVDRDGVFVYRSLEDLRRIRARAVGATAVGEGAAVVVGGGLLGIEAAAALGRLGLDVAIVERGPRLMARQLNEVAAALVREQLEDLGIRTLAATVARRIEEREGRLAISVAGRASPLTADLVVIATGMRPRDELAVACRLAVGTRPGGIIVNNELRTSDSFIYAIGECAWYRGFVHGQIAPGYEMADTLAEVMATGRGRFRPRTTATRLRLEGIEAWALGDPALLGRNVDFRGEGAYRRITLRAGQIVAARSVGPWEGMGVVQDFIERARPVWEWQLRRFRRTGELLAGPGNLPVAEWPASAPVCNCLAVTRGSLTAAIERGCATVDCLVAETGASTVCGACLPRLAELARDPAATVFDRGRGWLLGTAALAAALALAFVAGSPLPLATSFADFGATDLLYRSGGWRLATGFTLLALLLGTTALSLRKRWPRLRFGDTASWRIAHGALAALSLVVLVAHTGLRPGSGINLALTCALLTASVLGAAAALGFAGRRARLTFWLHLMAVWPLPVLIAFHIVAAFYF